LPNRQRVAAEIRRGRWTAGEYCDIFVARPGVAVKSCMAMEEPPLLTEVKPEAPKPRETSLLFRLLNVFAVPGLVFDEVKGSPSRVGNWLVPAILCAIVGTAMALTLLSQPEVSAKLRENYNSFVDKQVQAGGMRAADAGVAKAAFEQWKQPVIVCLGVGLGFVRVFWWAFVLWIFGLLFLRARFSYLKGLEVAGLAIMIGVLGSIVTLMLTSDLTPLLSGHAAVAINDAAMNRRSKLIAGAFEVFSIWQLIVMSIGLARLTGASVFRAAWFIFAYWLMVQSFFYFLGVGQGM
jgi:hypothetical protein